MNEAYIRGAFPRLSNDKKVLLNMEYSGEEVVQVLRGMGPLKAPGLDRFQALFYQSCWDTVGEDLSHLVLNILRGNKVPSYLAKALLVLIPKIEKPVSIKHF